MKFNCQQCGAKYQIADERVAGKLVRMKCRKCSDQIRVRARKMPDGSVTPHYVGDSEHVSHLPPASVMPGSLKPPPSGHGVRVPSRRVAPRSEPAAGRRPIVRSGGTQLGLGVPLDLPLGLPKPGAPPRRSGLPRLGALGRAGVPRPLGLPRPAGAAALPSRAPAPKQPVTSAISAQAPTPAEELAAQEPDEDAANEFDSEATMVMARSDFESRRRLAGLDVPGGAAPASASAAPASASAAPATSSPGLSSEPVWFVGIDEEPVGPVGADFLQKQVANGKIDGASLVWRDGMGEWEKLESISELDGVLTSAATASAPAAAASAPPAAASAPAAAASAPPAAASAPAAAASAPPLLDVPLPSAPAPAEATSAAPPAADSVPAPTADAAPISLADAATGVLSSSSSDAEAAKAEAKAAAIEAQEVAPTSRELAAAGIPVERRRSKRGMHPMAWAFIAMAAAFGAVAAWFLFGDQAASQAGPTATASAPQPAAASAATTAAPEDTASPKSDPSAQASASVAASSAPAANGSGRWPMAGGKASAAPSSEAPSKPCDPADPMCDPSVAGPSAGAGEGTETNKGTGLSQEQLQAVVNRNRRSVSRKCLALVRSGSARVGVTIKVLPSGVVSAVSTSGGKDHPGLAGCVGSRIRNWRFPTSGASTMVNVPFTFIAQ